MARNLAEKYSPTVDKRFKNKNAVVMATNKDYKFDGVATVNVYSTPTAPLNDYKRYGDNRYGEATDILPAVQSMTMTVDKGFKLVYDRGDFTQQQMSIKAGDLVANEIDEVVDPTFTAYCFNRMAYAAVQHGGYAKTKITNSNALEAFQNAQEYMGNRNVPMAGRVAFCTWSFANLLSRDNAFVRYGDASQKMLTSGVIGEVDGTKIVRMPSGYLPAGAAFILVHTDAVCAPIQLKEVKIHEDPPGISGWVIEGRVMYDCFVLNSKAHGVYYHGAQPVLKTLSLLTAPVAGNSAKTRIVNNTPVETGHSLVYKQFASAEDVPEVIYGTALEGWTAVANGAEVVVEDGAGMIAVCEVDAENKPVGFERTVINVAR